MKNRNLLAKKLKLFYEDIKQKRTGRMRLETDLEFKQNQIKNVTMNSMLKCFIQKCGEGKQLMQNKK